MPELEISFDEYLKKEYPRSASPNLHRDTEELPFDDQLNWETFERLIVLIASKKYSDARRYLKQGNKQDGIDIYCNNEDFTAEPEFRLKTTFIQCKKVEQFSPSKLKTAITEFNKGKFSNAGNRFIIAVKVDLRNHKKLTDEYQIQKREFSRKKIGFDIWDKEKLNYILREYPDIVAAIFDVDERCIWARMLCGDAKVNAWLNPEAEQEKKILEKAKISRHDLYIERSVSTNVTDNKSLFGPRSWRQKDDLVDVIRTGQQKRIVLLSPAGSGKSAELKNIGFIFSDNREFLHPIFCHFRNYIDQDLEVLISMTENQWLNIPEERRLILLDGFDEVQQDKLDSAAVKLNLFSQKYPNSTIVVSARSNFYKAQFEQFKIYYLEDFSEDDIRNYLKKSLRSQGQLEFEELAKRNKVWHLLMNAFNLIEFVKLFKECGAENFPKNRTQALDRLIEIKIAATLSKLPVTQEDNLSYSFNIRRMIEKLAVSMSQLGTNHLSGDSFSKIIPNHESRELLQKSLLGSISVNTTENWQFEHNNYQEYLTAVVLSKQSFENLKKIIAFEPDQHKIKPKWINTISFLMGILGEENDAKFSKMLEWLIEIEPDIFVKFEREIIPSEVRLKIFKAILSSYENQNIYMEYAGLRYSELAEFSGDEKPFVQYLYDELTLTTKDAHVANILSTLYHCNKFYEYETAIREKIMRLIKAILPANIHYDAIICLFKIGYGRRLEIDEVILKCPNAKTSRVRMAIIQQILLISICDDYVDFFLETLIISKKEFRQTKVYSTNYYLTLAIQKCTTPEAVKKILDFAIAHCDDMYKDEFYTYQEKFVDEEVVRNCIQAYTSKNGILEKMTMLLVLYQRQYDDAALDTIRPFFIETGTSLEVMKKLHNEKIENYDRTQMVCAVADNACVKYMIELYKQGEVDDNQVFNFRNLLRINDLHNFFYTQINLVSNDRFKYLDQINYTEIRAKQHKNDLLLFQNQEQFILEGKKIFTELGKSSATWDELWEFKRNLQHGDVAMAHTIVLGQLREMSRPQPITYERFYTRFNDPTKWRWFVVYELTQRLQNKEAIEEWHKEFLTKWCNDEIVSCNFRTAIWDNPQGSGIRYRTRENIIAYLWSKLAFHLPENTLLDMLSFDYSGFRQSGSADAQPHKRLSDLIIECLQNTEKVKKRILQNIGDVSIVSWVLVTNIQLCKELQITESTYSILKSIMAGKIQGYEIKIASEIYLELGGNANDLKEFVLSCDLNIDWHWDLVELIHPLFPVDTEIKMEKWFNSTIGKETFKLRALPFLLAIGSEGAYNYLLEVISTSKRFPWGFRSNFDLSHYNPPKVIADFFELLLFSYNNDIEEDIVNDYNSEILNLIWKYALISANHFDLVKKAILKFIRQNSKKHKSIKNLFYWMRNLEREYYLNLGDVKDLNEVIATTENLMQHI